MNNFSYINLQYGVDKGIPIRFLPLFFLIIAWLLFWKGLALWHAAKRGENKWFIAILILNTFSILELIYLFHFVKVKLKKLW